MSVHIGEIIEKKFQESGLKIDVFAKKISTGTRNVYSIFKREDISSDLLVKISKVLNYNFFVHYQAALPDLLREPEAVYEKSSRNISMTFTVSGSIEAYNKEFPEFLKAIVSEAKTHGFTLK